MLKFKKLNVWIYFFTKQLFMAKNIKLKGLRQIR